MPEVFRFYGFSFFYYSKEHEPIHIHVEGKDGYAKYELQEENFVMVEVHNIKRNDLKKIEQVIEDNKDLIIKHWNNYFNR